MSSLELFAFFMLTGIFSTLLLPETKGKSLEDLSNENQEEFVRGKCRSESCECYADFISQVQEIGAHKPPLKRRRRRNKTALNVKLEHRKNYASRLLSLPRILKYKGLINASTRTSLMTTLQSSKSTSWYRLHCTCENSVIIVGYKHSDAIAKNEKQTRYNIKYSCY